MATDVVVLPQSMVEIRTHFVDFAPDIPDGVTVATVTAEHVPSSGIATTPTVSMAQKPLIGVTLGPVGVLGVHTLIILATLSDGEKIEARLRIPVNV
jgi:hypothetical protein